MTMMIMMNMLIRIFIVSNILEYSSRFATLRDGEIIIQVRIYDNAMNAEVEEDEIEMEGTEGMDGMEDVELRG